METDEAPLPAEAMQVARNWLRLAPEVQASVATMIEKMVQSSSKDDDPPAERPRTSGTHRPHRQQ